MASGRLWGAGWKPARALIPAHCQQSTLHSRNLSRHPAAFCQPSAPCKAEFNLVSRGVQSSQAAAQCASVQGDQDFGRRIVHRALLCRRHFVAAACPSIALKTGTENRHTSRALPGPAR